jgi:hypothetical protein
MLLGVKNAKLSPRSPNTEFGLQNLKFDMSLLLNFLLMVKKVKKSLKSPNTEFRLQYQIYKNIYRSEKINK